LKRPDEIASSSMRSPWKKSGGYFQPEVGGVVLNRSAFRAQKNLEFKKNFRPKEIQSVESGGLFDECKRTSRNEETEGTPGHDLGEPRLGHLRRLPSNLVLLDVLIQAVSWCRLRFLVQDSTWLGNLLCSVPNSCVLFEPLQLQHVPEAKSAGFSWRSYVDPETK